MHICIRGTKGKNYEKVLKWYNVMYPQAAHLVELV